MAEATAGFWTSGASLIAVAAPCALLLVLAVWLVLRKPRREGVRSRVGSYSASDAPAGEAAAEEPRRSGLIGRLEHGSWWPTYVEAVAVSRHPRSPAYLMRRAGLVGVVIAVLADLISGTVVLALIPIFAFPFVERTRAFRAADKQRTVFRDSLPGYIQDMASAIRVGRTVVNALSVIAETADEPSRSEFERAVSDESLGRPLDESLRAVGERMRCDEIEQVALIAELNRRSGSNVAEALDRVAEGAREHADLRREMRALTAQAKMSSSVLTGLPFFLLLAMSFIAPSYAHPLFHTVLGIVAMCFGVVLVFAGWKVMKKIAFVENV